MVNNVNNSVTYVIGNIKVYRYEINGKPIVFDI